ncbi:unnamed protein product [Orchesella dallaii]|uniref:Odorant receptor n=1 Tax=Orchesella dallaii TaxID=48710 RepID=A0ABP1S1P5_9HEXA
MLDYSENTILTPLVRTAVNVHKRVFFYLYPHLFEHQIDEDAGIFKIIRAKWSWKLIPFVLSVTIFTTILGLGCSFYVCATHFLGMREGRHKLELDNLLEIEFLAALGCLEVSSLMILAMKPLIMTCFHEVFHLERRCSAYLQNRRREPENIPKDWIGPALIFVTIWMAVSGPFGVVFALAVHGDPFYYVAEEILPDPHYRSMTLIILTPIIRYILSFFCVMEFIRIGVHGMFFGLLIVSVVHNLLEKIPKIESNAQSFRIYFQMKVIFAVASGMINTVAFYLVIVGQIMTVLVLWGTIRLNGIVLPLVSYFFLSVSLLFLGLAVVLLRAPALITLKTATYLKDKCIVNPRLKYHQSIQIRCGSFFVFKHSTVMSYFNNIANNLTTAVLLVQP